MNITPTSENIFIEPITSSEDKLSFLVDIVGIIERKKNNIILLDEFKDKCNVGRIIKIGNNVKNIKEGDVIFFDKHASKLLKLYDFKSNKKINFIKLNYKHIWAYIDENYNIYPKNDRVLISEKNEKKKSLIEVPEKYRDKKLPIYGDVLDIGESVKSEINKNDNVIFSRYGFRNILIKKNRFILCKETDILCIY
jgi:co-chaperonin GroES (HSP10)